MARDLSLGEKGLSELNKFQTKNKNRNNKINIELEKLGVKANYKKRLQYKILLRFIAPTNLNHE